MILAELPSADPFIDYAQLGALSAIIGLFVWLIKSFIPKLMDDNKEAVNDLSDKFIKANDQSRADYRADLASHREHSEKLAERGHQVVEQLAHELRLIRQQGK